ncbi:MAG: S8 family serine peptidase [Sphingobium sp.]|nr:S8 family serine peptidase [Sphingobium sp.]
MRFWRAHLSTSVATLMLAGCGGGSGGQVASAPVPTPAPTATTPSAPVTTPAAAGTNFDTAEYRLSAGLGLHNAIKAYEGGASGEGVLVGVIDSGLTDADGEFTDRISPLSKDFGGNGTYADQGGHGTAVAETLAGARNDKHVQGMAWGATLLALRTDKPGSCLGSGCEHTTAAMAQAVDYAWRSGARVINISLGGDVSASDLAAAVSRATAAGTIVVIAAGNAKSGQAPSASPDQLAVQIANPSVSHGLVIVATSVGSDGVASSFSNGAKGYEGATLSALGDSVRTIDNKGTDLLYTGTSFSAPQISGAAALLAQAFPNLSSLQIVQLLLTTARDAGATGPDALYGMGILDVGRAFQPQGQLSLAGTAVPMSTGDTTLLSTAMGDAHSAGLATVVLDSYRRAFSTDLSENMMRPGLRGGRLTAALTGASQSLRGRAGPLSIAFNIAPGKDGAASVTPLDLGRMDQRQARFLSGTISAALSERSVMAFGLRTGIQALSETLDGAAHPAFLVAGTGTLGELRADSSIAWRRGLGHGLALTSGVEAGTVDGIADRVGLAGSRPASRAARYQALNSEVSFDRGSLGLLAGVRLVSEQGSALGARFAPALGAQSARSLFASMGARVEPIPGLTLTASAQRGWTYAQAGGALDQGGLIRSRSWSLDLARTGLVRPGDLAGLRVSAPLRVTASRFDLLLPQSWDWQSATATMARMPLNLVPTGAERDYELSYGFALSGGWLGTNVFARTQPGNIAAAPDDYGAALRWSARF